MGNLKDTAIAFQKLLDYEYYIELRKKDKIRSFVIKFRKQDFFHLAGLQYIKDLPQLKKNRDVVFDNIINEKITDKIISKSSFYNSVCDRITGLANIEKILDCNETIFRYFKSRSSFSNIDAEYFLQTVFKNETNYIFIDRDGENNMYCKSFFFNENNNYKINQIHMELIKKIKINKITDEQTVLFDKTI